MAGSGADHAGGAHALRFIVAYGEQPLLPQRSRGFRIEGLDGKVKQRVVSRTAGAASGASNRNLLPLLLLCQHPKSRVAGLVDHGRTARNLGGLKWLDAQPTKINSVPNLGPMLCSSADRNFDPIAGKNMAWFASGWGGRQRIAVAGIVQ